MSNYKKSRMHYLMKIPGIRDFIAGYWLIKRHVFHIYDGEMRSVSDDHIAPFDEYSNCLLCGSDDFTKEFKSQDGMNIDRCNDCNLLQTRPKIKRQIWEKWLQKESERSEQYTENRLAYGYALDNYIKYSSSLWRWRIRRNNKKKLSNIFKIMGKTPSSIHDIGCGVGFFIMDARDIYNIQVSGNDLNKYAVKAMNTRYSLDVVLGTEKNSKVLDKICEAELITITDVIEHLYDPLDTLNTIFNSMKKDSYLFLTTFHIDCKVAEINGANWDMHCWNHIAHFSKNTLEQLVKKVGFKIKYSDFPYESPECKLLLSK